MLRQSHPCITRSIVEDDGTTLIGNRVYHSKIHIRLKKLRFDKAPLFNIALQDRNHALYASFVDKQIFNVDPSIIREWEQAPRWIVGIKSEKVIDLRTTTTLNY